MSFVEQVLLADKAGNLINPATSDAQTDGTQKTALVDNNGDYIGANSPIPISTDSVYDIDIDVGNSSIGTFTGDIESLFNDYGVEITDSTASNPKTFTIRLNRPISSKSIGFGSSTGNFSNVKIKLNDLSGVTRNTIDDSSNSTKYTSNIYSFVESTFIEVVVEFHTADPVAISGSFVPKTQAVAISSIAGLVSAGNSSSIALSGGGLFTGEEIDTLNYGMVIVSVYADAASGTDGLSVQFKSTSLGTWRESDAYTIPAGAEKTFTIQTVRRFMRIVYTNGLIAQAVFDLQVSLKPVYIKPSSHRISDNVSGEDDAELVKAAITGQRDDGIFSNCILDNADNLRTNSFPYTYSIAEGVIAGHDSISKFGTRTSAGTALSTIWEGPTALYQYLSTAQQLQVTSTDNVGDNVGGSGALTLKIFGLDSAYNEINETVTMTGTTQVTTTLSYIRIFRAYVDTCGTSLSNTGVISIKNNAGTVTQAIINIGDSQTLMAMWTVPAGKVAYLTNGSFSTNSNKGSAISFVIRQMDGGTTYPFRIQYRAFVFSGNENFPFTIPLKIPGKVDIEARTVQVSLGADCGATFECWYEDV